MTRKQITQRLEKLQAEYNSGQQMLAELAAKQENLKSMLLRISGAIQVLEELLAEFPLAASAEEETSMQRSDGSNLPNTISVGSNSHET